MRREESKVLKLCEQHVVMVGIALAKLGVNLKATVIVRV